MLPLASAYIILRPFFRPKCPSNASLAFEDWELDIDGTSFPGSVMTKFQQLNETTHPHLRLDKTMISLPKVEPGDQVYCPFGFLVGLNLVHIYSCIVFREQGIVTSSTLLKLSTRAMVILLCSTFLLFP